MQLYSKFVGTKPSHSKNQPKQNIHKFLVNIDNSLNKITPVSGGDTVYILAIDKGAYGFKVFLDEIKKYLCELISTIPSEIYVVFYSYVKENWINSPSVDVIKFDKTTKLDEFREKVNSINPVGQSCLSSSFEALTNIFIENDRKLFSIGYMTNYLNSNDAEFGEKFKKFSNHISTLVNNCVFHFLSYSESDISYIEQVLKISSVGSSYQYCNNLSSLYRKFKNMIDTMSTNYYAITFSQASTGSDVVVSENYWENPNKLSGYIFVTLFENEKLSDEYLTPQIITKTKNPKSRVTTIYAAQQILDGSLFNVNGEECIDMMDYIEYCIKHRLKAIFDCNEDEYYIKKHVLGKFSNKLRFYYDELLKIVDKIIKNVHDDSRRFQIARAKKAEKNMKTVAKFCYKFTKNNVDNELYCKICQLMYEPQLTPEKLVESYDFLKLKKIRHVLSVEYDELKICELSKKSVAQLLENSDYPCLALNIVVEHGKFVKIEEIHPFIVSANMFCDLIKLYSGIFSLPISKKVNMIFPLYFEDNDNLYLEFNKILGRTMNHIKFNDKVTIWPFIVLSKSLQLIKNENTCTYQVIANSMMELCKKIYQDNKLDDFLVTNLEHFKNGNLGIFLKNIENIEAFAMHIFVSKFLKKENLLFDEEKNLELIRLLVFEELRRSLHGVKKYNITDNDLMNFLNIDRDVWIVNFEGRYIDSIINYINETKKILGDNFEKCLDSTEDNYPPIIDNDEIKFQFDEVSDLMIADMHLDILSEEIRCIYDKICKIYDGVISKSIQLYCDLLDINIEATLQNLGIDTSEKIIMFSLQIYMYHHDNKFYGALSELDGKYIDPFSQEECREYIKNTFTRLILEERRHIIDTINMCYDGFKEIKTFIFETSTNLSEVAGALRGVRVGLNISKFCDKLKTAKCPNAGEKIKMITDGNYLGVRLLSDSDTYKFGKKTGKRIWANNPNVLEQEEWDRLLVKSSTISNFNRFYQPVK